MFDKSVTIKSRFFAMALHSILSLVLLGAALYLVYRVWYPMPLNIALGVTYIYLLVLIVDIVIGPCLTFLIYKADKKKLLFDLTVILIIQLSAYIFGLYILAQGRPAWLVFVVDDVELVSPIDISQNAKKQLKPEFTPHFLQKPIWVAAAYSDDPKIKQKQKEDEIFNGLSMSVRPETYQSLHYKRVAVLTKLRPLNELKKYNPSDKIDAELKPYSTVKGWLPVKAPELDMVALFNQQGKPLTIVNLRPWN